MTADGSARAPASAATEAPVLRVEGLTKRYGRLLAVRALDLELRAGEVFGLLGPNGCGKSTTLGIILGHLHPTAGSVHVLGVSLAHNRREALPKVGGLVDGPAFYPYLSGRENLRLLAAAHGLDLSVVEPALAAAGLTERADDRFGIYSLGMKQRLGVAAAILHSPRLVILDEPTNGLDPAGTREMRALIPRIAEQGRTVLLASHLLYEVEQVCDRVAIMQDGSIVAQGTVEALLGAGQRVAVTVAPAERPRARKLLASLAAVMAVEIDGEDLLVDVENGDAALLNERLAAAGIYASQIQPAGRSLETLFLELTGQGAVS